MRPSDTFPTGNSQCVLKSGWSERAHADFFRRRYQFFNITYIVWRGASHVQNVFEPTQSFPTFLLSPAYNPVTV